MSVRGRRTSSSEQLRRRPTAGKRSSQAQPFGRHLLSYFCEQQPTTIRPGDLPALELRLALLFERGDPFVGILGNEHPPDRLALDGKPEIQGRPVALSDGELGMADGDARAGCELR